MKRITSRDSFTLIELLIVIVVMGVLAGLVFKLMNSADKRQKMAVCIQRLERLSHAIEEYKSEYGQYPPVQPNVCVHGGDCRMCYMYESPTNMPGSLRYDYFKKNNDANSDLFRYGLVAFLAVRDKGVFEHSSWTDKDGVGHPTSSYIMDLPRDVVSKGRWYKFLYEPDSLISGVPGGAPRTVAGITYTNGLDTVWSLPSMEWGIIHYKSDPPYLTYDLWSDGPDGKGIHKGGRME